MKRMVDLEREQQPSYKLMNKGVSTLSDVELLMLILADGCNNSYEPRQTASDMIKRFDQRGLEIKVEDLTEYRGIGVKKASAIIATIELTRRRIREDGIRINRPGKVFPLIQHYGDRKQEHFIVIQLNGANEVMSIDVVTIGLLNKTQVHPREVFADAIAKRAASVIIAHNHPSGNLTPSSEDLSITKRLREAGDILGIRLLDHLIFSSRGYISLADRNEL